MEERIRRYNLCFEKGVCVPTHKHVRLPFKRIAFDMSDASDSISQIDM